MQLSKGVAEVSVGIDAREATAQGDGVRRGGAFTARFVTDEQIVFPAEGHRFPKPLQGVVVNRRFTT